MWANLFVRRNGCHSALSDKKIKFDPKKSELGSLNVAVASGKKLLTISVNAFIFNVDSVKDIVDLIMIVLSF